MKKIFVLMMLVFFILSGTLFAADSKTSDVEVKLDLSPDSDTKYFGIWFTGTDIKDMETDATAEGTAKSELVLVFHGDGAIPYADNTGVPLYVAVKSLGYSGYSVKLQALEQLTSTEASDKPISWSAYMTGEDTNKTTAGSDSAGTAVQIANESITNKSALAKSYPITVKTESIPVGATGNYSGTLQASVTVTE